jgi:hypothetical protein
MVLVKYTDDKHIKMREWAKSKYHEKYKLRKKILYLCRKLDLDRDEFIKNYEDEKSCYLELIRLQSVKKMETFENL